LIGRIGTIAWLIALASLALLSAACASVAGPQGWARPVLESGTLFVSTDRGEMAALDAEDNSITWIFPRDDEFRCDNETRESKKDLEAIYGGPVLAGNNVYLAGYDGNVYALNAEDAACSWIFETDGPIIGGLAIADGTLYVGSDDGKLYALDVETGEQVWDQPFDAGDSLWTTPLVAGHRLYLSSMNGRLYALDAETGEQVWDQPFDDADGGLVMDPVLADETTILVGGIDRTLYALDIADGAVKWSFKADNWFWAKPLVVERRVYAPSLDGGVYALDLDSGEKLWDAPFEADSPIRSSPLLAPGSDAEMLIVIDRSGNVYGLDPDTGILAWSAPAELDKTVLSDPILLGGEVLVVAQGGDLFTVDPAAGASRSLQVGGP
jgi:outer membrane protein assembly factor BamB